jgi:Skp family chaperone for outer membrane proteins
MPNHRYSRVLLAVAVIAVCLCIVTPAAAQQRIGIFDAARVSEETDEGRQVQARLEAFRTAKQAEITAKEQEVANLQNQLNTQALSLSPERQADLNKQIQRKLLELNQTREAATSEMQIEIGEAQARFQEQLLAVIDDLGREEGFAVILEASLVAYADKSADITTAIVDRFNEVFKVQPEAGSAGSE